MDEALQRKDEIRLRLLRVFYQITDGRENCSIGIDKEIAGLVGASLDEALAAARFLDGEGLLKGLSAGADYQITHAGTVEVEESLRDPDRGTKHFQPVVIVSANSYNGANSVIGSSQTGGTGNVANVDQMVTTAVHQSALQALRNKVKSLPPEQHEEVHSVIDQIEEMLEKGPKAWAAVRVMITGLVTYWPDAVPWLTNVAQHMLGG